MFEIHNFLVTQQIEAKNELIHSAVSMQYQLVANTQKNTDSTQLILCQHNVTQVK